MGVEDFVQRNVSEFLKSALIIEFFVVCLVKVDYWGKVNPMDIVGLSTREEFCKLIY